MATEKTTYWVALGVAALLLGNHFVQKTEWNCYRVRALTAMERMSDSTNLMADRIQASLDQSSSRYEQVQSRVAYAEARMASVQCLLAQKQASLERAQALREQRVMIIERLRNSAPRQRIDFTVPRHPVAGDDGLI